MIEFSSETLLMIMFDHRDEWLLSTVINIDSNIL